MRNAYNSGDLLVLENAFEVLVHNTSAISRIGKTPLHQAFHEIEDNAVCPVVNTDHGSFEY